MATVAQRANVDLRRDEYIVWSSSRTVSGIWRMNGSFRRVPASAGAAGVAQALEWALAQSRIGTPDLTSRDALQPIAMMLADLKLSSYGQYTRGLKMTAVERGGDAVSVTPYVNNGPRRGQSADLDRAVDLRAPTPEQIAHAVVALLETR